MAISVNPQLRILLPEPEPPTSAVVSPARIVTLISEIARTPSPVEYLPPHLLDTRHIWFVVGLVEYPNETLSSENSPRHSFGFSPSGENASILDFLQHRALVHICSGLDPHLIKAQATIKWLRHESAGYGSVGSVGMCLKLWPHPA